jgi:hypothetical protein
MKDVLEKFIQFEKKYMLFDRKIKDIFYWHLIRTWVYYCLLKNTDSYDSLNKKRGKTLNIVRKIGVVIINDLINIKQIPYKKNRCEIIFSNFYDYRIVEGKEKDIFIDFLNINDTYRTRKYEYNDQFHISIKSDINSCYADTKMFFSYALNKIRFNKNRFENEYSFIEKLVEDINKEFDVNLCKEVFIRRLEYSICIFNSYYRSIRLYLKKIEPKAVIMICAYGLRHYATIKAAKDLGIITIELQHGVIVPWHIDYNYAELQNSSVYFPEHLFTFGEYWSKVCRTPKCCTKRAVGYALVDYHENRKTNQYRDSNVIVFYSTGEESFAQFVSRFANITSQLEYKIIFKFHPSECGRVKYTCLNKKGIEIVDYPEEVYTYINRYEHHVSIGSTVLFEAAMRGASIYVLNGYGKEYMEDLLEKGYGVLIENEHELLDKIEHSINFKNMELSKELLTPNANKNINAALEEILDDREVKA